MCVYRLTRREGAPGTEARMLLGTLVSYIREPACESQLHFSLQLPASTTAREAAGLGPGTWVPVLQGDEVPGCRGYLGE